MDLGLRDATVVVTGERRAWAGPRPSASPAEGARVAVLARARGRWTTRSTRCWRAGSPDAIGIPTDLTLGAVGRGRVRVRSATDGAALNVLVNAAGPVDVGIGAVRRRR